jgi:hypothetical protein
MRLKKQQAIVYSIALLFLGIGFMYAKPLAMLIDYSWSRLNEDRHLTVGSAKLQLPKAAWVLSREGPGAVIGFLRDFGQVDRLHVLPRHNMSPEAALTRQLSNEERASAIEPYSIGAVSCYRRTITKGELVIEGAAYCPSQGLLFVVDADQVRAWDRVAELFPSAQPRS